MRRLVAGLALIGSLGGGVVAAETSRRRIRGDEVRDRGLFDRRGPEGTEHPRGAFRGGDAHRDGENNRVQDDEDYTIEMHVVGSRAAGC